MAPSSVQSALTWDGAALSTLGVMRWQDISDNNCGSGNGCFTTLAIHFTGHWSPNEGEMFGRELTVGVAHRPL